MTSPSQFASIRAFVFDVDGVLTNSHVLVTEAGELLRSVSIRDGYALKRAVDLGYGVAIITGGASAGVRKRFENLGVTDYYSGVRDKLPVLQAYLERHKLTASQTLYMGDDIPDLACVAHAGLGCAPADACAEVLAKADYVASRNGGAGCAREVIEAVLKTASRWLPA